MEFVNLMDCLEVVQNLNVPSMDIDELIRNPLLLEGDDPELPTPRPWKCPIYTF